MSDIKWLQKQEHFDWMQKCLTCWKMCEEFIAWSIQNGKFVSSINVCRDAAEMCSQCIKFEAQCSPFFQQLCEVSAEICNSCVTELSQYEKGNDIFTQTISACNEFANTCIEMAGKQKKNTIHLPE